MAAAEDDLDLPKWSGYEFAAWVPSITGRVSFCAIGNSSGRLPYKVRRLAALSNAEDKSGAYPQLVVFQRRPNREFAWLQRCGGLINEFHRGLAEHYGFEPGKASTPYDEWYSKKLGKPCELIDEIFPAHSTSFYLLQANLAPSDAVDDFSKPGLPTHTDQRGALVGKVWLLRKNTLFKNRRLSAAMRRLAGAKEPQRAQLWSEVEKICAEFRASVVSFVLYRTGELRLKLRTETLHWLPNEGEDKERDPPHQVRQAYYFIRDCAHSHYHHHAHADQILGVRKVERGPNGDVGWRRESLWDLARAIINMRRERQIFRRRDALGVAAYAEMFQGTLATVRRTSSEKGFARQNQIDKYDLQHLKQSIAAENDSSSFRIQGTTSVTFASMAGLLTLAMMHHSASAIIVAHSGVGVCVLSTNGALWLVGVILMIFGVVWDIHFRRASFVRGVNKFIENARLSFVRSYAAISISTIALSAVFVSAYFGHAPTLDRFYDVWRAANPFCIAQ